VALYLCWFYAAPLPSLHVGGDQQAMPLRIDSVLLLLLPLEMLPQLAERWLGDPIDVGLLDRVPLVALSALAWIVAWATGSLVIGRLGLRNRLTALERAVFGIALGLGLMSLFTLLIGLAGLLNNVLVVALPSAAVLAAAGRQRARRILDVSRAATSGEQRTDDRTEPEKKTDPESATGSQSATGPVQPTGPELLTRRWLWLALPPALLIVLGAMLPPVEFDVLEYHAQAPKEYFQNGRIEFLPHNVYANMPLGTEMLSLLGMVVSGDWWTGALVGKTLIGLFAPLAALALLAAGLRLGSLTAGVVAASGYLAIPWIAMVSTLGLVEGVLACYLLLTWYALWLWVAARKDGGAGNSSWLFLAGLFAGSAVACKYPAALFVLVPTVVFVVAIARGRATQGVMLLLLGAAICSGPWLGRNLMATGNPTYPLLHGWFGPESRSEALDARWRAAHRPPNFEPGDLIRRMGDVLLYSEWNSPLIVPLAVLAFMAAGHRRLKLWALGYAAFVLLAWWLLTHRIDRFWIPLFPIFALLAGWGATWNRGILWRRVLKTLLIGTTLANVWFMAIGLGGDNRFLVSLESLREDPQRVPSWVLYLKRHVPTQGRVLSIGDAAVFRIEAPVLYNTVFDASRLEGLARGRTPRQVHAQFVEQGITHLYVNWNEIGRYRQRGNYGFTDFVQPDLFRSWVEAGVLDPPLEEFRFQGVDIFRVRPPDANVDAEPSTD
jgi:4-amino-4-deoxy-L-arabinose transferase-like glycosyltransferase